MEDDAAVTLQPVDHDPWADVPRPNGVPRLNIGPPAQFTDPMSGANLQQLQAGGNIAIGAGQGIVNQLAAPGRVAQGQQPATPGMWSDEDEARAQMNAAGQYNWGPGMALNMVGGGSAATSTFGPADSLGVTGGRLIQKAVEGANEPGLRGDVGSGGVAEAPGAAQAPVSLEQAVIAQARAKAAATAQGRPPLEGLPQEPIKAAGYYVPGPNGQIHDIAEQYMQSQGLPYNPPKTYQKVDRERAENIAQEYEDMRHNPADPDVAASYKAMISETMAQYQALKNSGYTFNFIQPGMENPYAATPRLAAKDLNENKHLWVYPTASGHGKMDATEAELAQSNPLLGDSGEKLNGIPMTHNDVFRIVHDIYGHFKDGNGFRADGEENAWRSHSAMYSDAARPAMTSETRGQNSWVNFGPNGAANRTANAADTVYADQKVGLLPDWVVNEGRYDPGYTPPASPYVQRGLVNPVANRFPGIYDNPRLIAARAAANVAPEDPALKELFGVTRQDLYDIGEQGTRQGNMEPQIATKPGGGKSKIAQAVMTPENAQRLIDINAEAGKYPELYKGMDAWYVMDPAYQRLEELVGPEMARAEYSRLNAGMGMHSPASDVETEINRGTTANMLAAQGRYREWLRRGGQEGGIDPDVRGHPYHSTSQAPQFNRWLQNPGTFGVTPKVPLYVQASGVPQTGFQTKLPVPDAHFTRGLGMPDVRNSATPNTSMFMSEYQPVGPWYRENVAKPLGLEAVPAQARQWGATSRETGVESAIGAPKLEILAGRIKRRAQRLGIDPKVLRDQVLRGQGHAQLEQPSFGALA